MAASLFLNTFSRRYLDGLELVDDYVHLLGIGYDSN